MGKARFTHAPYTNQLPPHGQRKDYIPKGEGKARFTHTPHAILLLPHGQWKGYVSE